jgi:hypothetical protein
VIERNEAYEVFFSSLLEKTLAAIHQVALTGNVTGIFAG